MKKKLLSVFLLVNVLSPFAATTVMAEDATNELGKLEESAPIETEGTEIPEISEMTEGIEEQITTETNAVPGEGEETPPTDSEMETVSSETESAETEDTTETTEEALGDKLERKLDEKKHQEIIERFAKQIVQKRYNWSPETHKGVSMGGLGERIQFNVKDFAEFKFKPKGNSKMAFIALDISDTISDVSSGLPADSNGNNDGRFDIFDKPEGNSDKMSIVIDKKGEGQGGTPILWTKLDVDKIEELGKKPLSAELWIDDAKQNSAYDYLDISIDISGSTAKMIITIKPEGFKIKSDNIKLKMSLPGYAEFGVQYGHGLDHKKYYEYEINKGNSSTEIPIEIPLHIDAEPTLTIENPELQHEVNLKTTDGKFSTAVSESNLTINNFMTEGYVLSVRRLTPDGMKENLFPEDKLAFKKGESWEPITSGGIATSIKTGGTNDSLMLPLHELLRFDNLGPDDWQAMYNGKNTVPLIWTLATDAGKIMSEESL